jgi:hypothetical protein
MFVDLLTLNSGLVLFACIYLWFMLRRRQYLKMCSVEWCYDLEKTAIR